MTVDVRLILDDVSVVSADVASCVVLVVCGCLVCSVGFVSFLTCIST